MSGLGIFMYNKFLGDAGGIVQVNVDNLINVLLGSVCHMVNVECVFIPLISTEVFATFLIMAVLFLLYPLLSYLYLLDYKPPQTLCDKRTTNHVN